MATLYKRPIPYWPLLRKGFKGYKFTIPQRKTFSSLKELFTGLLRVWNIRKYVQSFVQVYGRISSALQEIRQYLVPDKNDNIRKQKVKRHCLNIVLFKSISLRNCKRRNKENFTLKSNWNKIMLGGDGGNITFF